MKIVRLVAALVTAATLTACSGISSPSTYAPDDFSGTLDPSGEASRGFSVAATGELQLQLTALNPVPRVGFLSMGVGQYLGSVCSPTPNYIVGQVGLNQQYSLGRITKGNYCVVLVDANAVLTAPATFTIRILHP